MDDMPGAAAAWDVPAAFGDTAGASWGGRADLGDFSWFGSPLEADLAPLMQPMQPVGLPLPPPPLPLAADPLGQGFELLLAQSQGAAQPQWVQQFAQPQYQQQQPWDLIQPAPQQPAGGDGGGARSGRRAASAADAQEARRVRNRAAQARFREKQKAKDAALIAEHAAASAELERTRQEGEDLAAHGEVLQKVLDAKDACIAVLGAAAKGGTQQEAQQAVQDVQQQQQQQQQRLLQAPAVAPATEAAAAAAAAAPPPALLPRQPSGVDLAGMPLSSAVKEQLQRMSATPISFMVQMDLPPTAHPDETMAVAVAHQDGTLAIPRKHNLQTLVKERPDLVQKALEAPPEDHVAGWRRCAAAFKEILARYDATGSAAELEHIHRLFREFSGQMAITLHYKPENAQALFATGAQAPPGHWERIAACLDPTEAQRAALRHMWRSFAVQLQAIRAERAEAMQAAVAASAVTPDNLPASTLGGLMSGYLALVEATGRLSTLQDEEFVAMLQLTGRAGAVFSPLQKARVAAASSPYFPDSVRQAGDRMTSGPEIAGPEIALALQAGLP